MLKINKKIKYPQIHKTTRRKNQKISILIQLNSNRKNNNYSWYLDKFQLKRLQNS